MNCLLRALWADEAGLIVSAELIVVATTVILGLTVAMVAVRQAIGAEFTEIAGAFRGLDQSYYKSGVRGCRKPNGTLTSWTAGSSFMDPTLRTSGPNPMPDYDDVDVGAFQAQRAIIESETRQGLQVDEGVFQPVPSVGSELQLDLPVIDESLNNAPAVNVPLVIEAPQQPLPVLVQPQCIEDGARSVPKVIYESVPCNTAPAVITVPAPVLQDCLCPEDAARVFDPMDYRNDERQRFYEVPAAPVYRSSGEHSRRPVRTRPVERSYPVYQPEVVGLLQVW